MYSKYKKPNAPKDAGKSAPASNPKVNVTAVATAPQPESRPAMMKPQPAKRAGDVAPMDKEKRRKERLGEIKLELHKRLLDNLNLGALEQAAESDLRAEIVSISGEALDERGVVLNREVLATLNQ